MRDHLELYWLPHLDLIDGTQWSHLTVGRYATQRVHLDDKVQGDRMVDEVIATDTVGMQGQQMTMKGADNGHEIAGILNSIPIASGLFWTGSAPSATAVRFDISCSLGGSDSKEQAGVSLHALTIEFLLDRLSGSSGNLGSV